MIRFKQKSVCENRIVRPHDLVTSVKKKKRHKFGGKCREKEDGKTEYIKKITVKIKERELGREIFLNGSQKTRNFPVSGYCMQIM